MITNTVHVHYTPDAEHQRPAVNIIFTSPGTPFASLTLGPQVSIIIDDPDVLMMLAVTAEAGVETLRKAKEATA